MEEQESAIFYTDLDTIFDTRLAVLHQFGVEVVNKNITGDYYTRTTDEFEGVDPEAYKQAYDNRDISIFKNMMLTGAIDLILDFAVKTIAAGASTPITRQPKLLVNTYPYKLPENAIQAILMGLVSVTKGVMTVELEEIPLEEITPEHVKKNYTTMCVYHFNKWMDAQGKNFQRKQCPQVALLVPAIFSSKEDLKLCGDQDPRRLVETQLGMLINIMMFPSAVFCVDFNRFIKNKIKQTGTEPVMEEAKVEGSKRQVA